MNLDSLNNAARSSEANIENMSKTMDPNNMEDMLKLQQEMGKLQVLYGTLSAVISGVKQTAQGIVQKM